MTNLPDDEIGDLLSDLSELVEEGVGIGPIKRIYNIVKKRIAKDYIDEIKRLRQRHEILMRSIESQTELNIKLRNYIALLEKKIEDSRESGESSE